MTDPGMQEVIPTSAEMVGNPASFRDLLRSEPSPRRSACGLVNASRLVKRRIDGNQGDLND